MPRGSCQFDCRCDRPLRRSAYDLRFSGLPFFQQVEDEAREFEATIPKRYSICRRCYAASSVRSLLQTPYVAQHPDAFRMGRDSSNCRRSDAWCSHGVRQLRSRREILVRNERALRSHSVLVDVARIRNGNANELSGNSPRLVKEQSLRDCCPNTFRQKGFGNKICRLGSLSREELFGISSNKNDRNVEAAQDTRHRIYA